MIWWAEWRYLYFELATLSTPVSPWERPKGGRIYSSGKYRFTDKDIGGEHHAIEEQLWAIRNNL